MSYRVTEHLRHRLRHTTLYYVINLEYRVIANHLSASGLRLAPHLTHAPSCQPDDRGAGDKEEEIPGEAALETRSQVDSWPEEELKPEQPKPSPLSLMEIARKQGYSSEP